MATVALFGYLNRWNDTMATELEALPAEVATEHLAASGWSAGSTPGPEAEFLPGVIPAH